MDSDSPFLKLPPSAWVASNALAFALRDGFPVSPGHTLVITRRLVRTWFEATREEQVAILDLVDKVKRQLDSGHPKPDGFNAGDAAGQTVPHLHVHIIPRYEGDMDDPRGGVRHVIPWKGNYRRATTRADHRRRGGPVPLPAAAPVPPGGADRDRRRLRAGQRPAAAASGRPCAPEHRTKTTLREEVRVGAEPTMRHPSSRILMARKRKRRNVFT